MIQIPDDPIIRRLERTGFPPWMEDEEEEPDEYQYEPFAVYDPG